jgi:hypothetical protein
LEKIFKNFIDFSDNNLEISLDLNCGFWIWDLKVIDPKSFSLVPRPNTTFLWEEAGAEGA